MDSENIRLIIFLAIFATMAGLEFLMPRRGRQMPRSGRWFANLTLTFADGLLVKLLFGSAAIGTATLVQQNGWGLLNLFDSSPTLSFVIGFLFLDMMIYAQHAIAHALPLLWRLHIVHHSDLDIDVTTALRFHPIEILFSMLYKMGLIAAMGIDPLTVLIFEVVLNGSAQFNHSNINIPKQLDAVIRLFIITPDMHRIHHSLLVNETNSNFGFFLSIWDRLGGTYRAESVADQTKMPTGLAEYRKGEELGLLPLLLMPFKAKLGNYSMRGDKA